MTTIHPMISGGVICLIVGLIAYFIPHATYWVWYRWPFGWVLTRKGIKTYKGSILQVIDKDRLRKGTKIQGVIVIILGVFLIAGGINESFFVAPETKYVTSYDGTKYTTSEFYKFLREQVFKNSEENNLTQKYAKAYNLYIFTVEKTENQDCFGIDSPDNISRVDSYKFTRIEECLNDLWLVGVDTRNVMARDYFEYISTSPSK